MGTGPELTTPLSPMASSSTTPIIFSYVISEKLSDTNFLVWKQQVEPVIKAHRLHRYLVNPSIPLQFLSLADHELGIENPEYTTWETQDQLLLSWLQSSLSAPFLARMLGCNHAFQVWDKIHTHFHSQTKARARQLRTELRTIKKGDRSISEFLLHIKALVHSLNSIGDPVSESEQLDILLEGLPVEYEAFLSLMHSKPELFSFAEIESLLVAQEARLERFKHDNDSVSLNLTQAHSQTASTPTVQVTEMRSPSQLAFPIRPLHGEVIISTADPVVVVGVGALVVATFNAKFAPSMATPL